MIYSQEITFSSHSCSLEGNSKELFKWIPLDCPFVPLQVEGGITARLAAIHFEAFQIDRRPSFPRFAHNTVGISSSPPKHQRLPPFLL
ncbi:hypothetical protein NPIL_501641 [Nephila pilipes]|uniref:Uncharacterized protein n=1 Tax=Nephila pilipes TaxID=299642 RepID=A0A8X6N3S4_NEPPI|nr:hypothetical protein NPIL_501641 [Nephila pilipes]